ncbi:MAG TPA: hypothetical protein VGB28_06735, partial [Actinomycetota bacterium]
HRFENEDVPTNGKVLFFSETGATLVGGGFNRLRVYDVTDPAAPVQIANVPNLGQHTSTCIDDCTYLYGSSGNIIDVRDPADPKLVGQWTLKAGVSGSHDVREVAPGLVAVSSGQGAILDVTDPENPVKLSITAGSGAKPAHSTWWDGEDRFLLGAQETNLNPRCTDSIGATTTWDMTDFRSGTYPRLDTWRATSGILFDGSPPVNVLGCSSHWLEASPAFSNGGVFAQGYYEHGSRFFYVNGAGKLRQVGFFVPFGGSTSAVHWATDRIVYAIDYTRGIDVLRWNGALPSEPDAATDVPELSATSGGEVSGSASFLGEATPTVIAEDPLGDGPGNLAQMSELGVDITEVSVSQPDATYPELVLNFKVSNLPNPVTGMQPENVRYVWTFAAGGKDWFVQAKASTFAQSTTADDPTGVPSKTTRAFQLRGNCGLLPPPPAPGVVNNCGHVAWLDGSFDATNKVVSVRIPIGASYLPQVVPGATLAPTTTPTDDIYAAFQVAADTVQTRDVVTYETSYTVPRRTVALGTALAGTDPAQVSFGAPMVVGADGAFSASLGSIPAGRDVYAKACFGNTCTVRSAAVS